MVLHFLYAVRLHLGATVVTDYGDENPLYFDYYGFSPELFRLKFKSRGDSHLANRIVGLYNKVGGFGPPRALTADRYFSRPGWPPGSHRSQSLVGSTAWGKRLPALTTASSSHSGTCLDWRRTSRSSRSRSTRALILRKNGKSVKS